MNSAFNNIDTEQRRSIFKSLILAQDERWRRALSMQVKGAPQGATGRRVSISKECTPKWRIARRKAG